METQDLCPWFILWEVQFCSAEPEAFCQLPHCCLYPLTFLVAYSPPTPRVRDSEGKMELQLPRHLAVSSFVHHFVADRTFFFFFSPENTLHANLCALADRNINACPLIQCLPVCLSSPCSPAFSCFTFLPPLSLTLLKTIHLSTTAPGYETGTDTVSRLIDSVNKHATQC